MKLSLCLAIALTALSVTAAPYGGLQRRQPGGPVNSCNGNGAAKFKPGAFPPIRFGVQKPRPPLGKPAQPSQPRPPPPPPPPPKPPVQSAPKPKPKPRPQSNSGPSFPQTLLNDGVKAVENVVSDALPGVGDFISGLF